MILENPEKFIAFVCLSGKKAGNGRISAETKATVILLGCTQRILSHFPLLLQISQALDLRVSSLSFLFWQEVGEDFRNQVSLSVLHAIHYNWSQWSQADRRLWWGTEALGTCQLLIWSGEDTESERSDWLRIYMGRSWRTPLPPGSQVTPQPEPLPS